MIYMREFLTADCTTTVPQLRADRTMKPGHMPAGTTQFGDDVLSSSNLNTSSACHVTQYRFLASIYTLTSS